MLRNCLLAVCLCAALGFASCAKRAPAAAPAPPAPPPPVTAVSPGTPPAPLPPPPPPAPPTPPAPVTLTEDQIFQRKSLEEINAENPLGDVFFEFDQSVVRDEARPLLQKNGDWLRRWTTTRITIEGHCDSRGSSEYNIALGDRRANAVKDYLVNLGVPAERVLTVSKGKEQPFCRDETENCWQQNRRGHFIVTRK